MPKRPIVLAIVAFWLGMAGLFAYEVLWPRLLPSEPVMFPIDIIDEAGRAVETTSWLVTKNGGEGYRANTDWEYDPENDTFRSHCELAYAQGKKELPRALGGDWLPQFNKVAVDSSYFLTRAGQMTRLEATTKYDVSCPALSAEAVQVSAKVSGMPHASNFVPHVQLSFPVGPGKESLRPLLPEDVERNGVPVAVLAHGLVFNPLHPPRRLPGLRPEQRWRLTVIDPFAVLDLAGSLGPGAGEKMRGAGIATDAGADVLDARVLPGEETVFWEEKNEHVTCHVIRCIGDGPLPALTLWVRERDGMLLKQEATTLSGDVWTFTRRPFGYNMKLAPPELTPLDALQLPGTRK